MKFRNHINGYVEEKSTPWLWSLLFGVFYFFVSGIFTHAVILAVASIWLFVNLGTMAVIPILLLQGYYAAVANPIVERHYLRRGWMKVAG